MQRYRPLTSELLRQLAAVAAIPILVTAVFFIWQLYPQLKQNVANEQQSLAGIVVEQSKQYLETAEEQVNFFIDFSITGTPDAAGKHIDRFVQQSAYFDTVYLLDYFGTIQKIGIRDANPEIISAVYTGMDISRSLLYRNPDQLNQANWSDVFLSVVTGRLSIAYMVPLDDYTLVAELAIDRLPQLSQSLSERGSLVMILDKQAQLIAHPNPDLSQQQINLSNLPFFEVADRPTISSSEFHMEGVNYFGTITHMNSPSWYVVVAQDERLFSARLYEILRNWLISMLIIVLLAMAISYRRSREFSTRFQRLNQLARSVARGEYGNTALDTNILEFKQLSESLSMMADAIERREMILQTQEQQLRNTLENAPNVAVQWYDARGTVGYWNDASERIFGYNREEAIGKRLNQLVFDPQPTAEFNTRLDKVARKEVANQEFDLPFHHKSGREGHLRGAIFSIPSRSGEDLYVCMATDVTKQRLAEASIRQLNAELEQHVEERTQALKRANASLKQTLETLHNTMAQLVQSEKLAALGSLVAGIAHELNTPIGNALMAASSLKDFSQEIRQQLAEGSMKRSDLDRFLDDADAACGITNRNLDRASELISSFKQVAVDQSSSQRRQFDVAELCNEILITLLPQTKKRPINICVEIPPDIEMDSYPGSFGQVISNLVMNAVNHAFSMDEPGDIIVRGKVNETDLELTVEDNGSGIAEEALSKVFDPFYTTRLGQGGSGLGLHIVHNIVTDVLGGSIEVSSTPGQGSRFTIKVPLSSPESGQLELHTRVS